MLAIGGDSGGDGDSDFIVLELPRTGRAVCGSRDNIYILSLAGGINRQAPVAIEGALGAEAPPPPPPPPPPRWSLGPATLNKLLMLNYAN